MPVYIVTGKLGSGKTLISVGKIKDRLNKGAKIATNLDLKIEKLLPKKSKKALVYRIPDKPNLADLESIGIGNDTYDESKNGLLVLDECGTWFNARSWNDKSRQEVINWFLHARKLGWDIIFLIQDISIMDKQARMALAEHVVYCRRLDRLAIPFVGGLLRLFAGERVTMPKVHLAIVKYGDQQTSMTVERWTYTGKSLYPAYDTKQAFSDSYEHGTYSLLPPWHKIGFRAVPRNWSFYMRMTRIYWKRFNRPFLLVAGVFIGSFSAYTLFNSDAEADAIVSESMFTITGYSKFGDRVSYNLERHGQQYSTHDLERRGYQVFPIDSCNFIMTKGGNREEISC